MISISDDCFETTTWSSPLTNTINHFPSSKPFEHRLNHIFTPLTNTMPYRSNGNARPAPHTWYSARPHYAHPPRRDVPPPPPAQPYPYHPAHHPHHSTLPSLVTSPHQYHMSELGRPSSASSGSSCMALTPTSTQLDGQSHLPAVCDPFVFIEGFQAPPGFIGASDEFLPQSDWRYAAAAVAADAPVTHIWHMWAQEDMASCMPKSHPPHAQFLQAPHIDGAYSDGSDVCSDEYDHDNLHTMQSLYPYPWQHDSSSTDHDDDTVLQQHDAYLHQSIRTHTPHRSTSNYSPAWQSPPEPTSSPPVSLSASSPACTSYQSSPSVSSQETHSSSSLCLYQPQPIRPIPIIPLSTLSESSLASAQTPSSPLPPGDHTAPVFRRSSRDYPPPHKSRRRTRSQTRSSRPAAAKTDLLSPLSLLCQPVSDSVRYQAESTGIDAIRVDEPGTSMMDDVCRIGSSPQPCRDTIGQMGGFFCSCGCFGSEHSGSMISGMKGV